MGKVLSLGFQFAAAIMLCGYAGLWADREFGTSPWGVLVGALIGFAAGFYSLYRVATASERGDDTGEGSK
jgi:ATP synthase protein I